MSDRYIEIDGFSLSPTDAEHTLGQLLHAYGHKMTPELRSGSQTLTLTPAKGAPVRISIAELLTHLHIAGVCELDRMRWLDTDPIGSLAMEAPEGLPVIIRTAFRDSPPLQGPGYATNDVVAELLEDVLIYRTDVAMFSSPGEMYRKSFRAYRAYLASSISAIDAYLNRLSWFARNDPVSKLAAADAKILARRTLPLDEKLRKWVPIIAGGFRIAEATAAWQNYQQLKDERNAAIHVNDPEFIFAPREAAHVLNLCRHGVGGLIAAIGEELGRQPSTSVLRVFRAPMAHFRSHM